MDDTLYFREWHHNNNTQINTIHEVLVVTDVTLGKVSILIISWNVLFTWNYFGIKPLITMLSLIFLWDRYRLQWLQRQIKSHSCGLYDNIFFGAIILIKKKELVALLGLSSWCLVIVVWLFLAVPWVCLRFVIVVFPDHTHLLYNSKKVLQHHICVRIL